MSVAVEPLGATFGARVTGRSPADLSADELTHLLAEHLLLCFDPSGLDDAGHEAVLAPLGQHPVTGRRYLDVNSAFTARIEGMDEAESTALLDFLFAHIARPDWHDRHRWTEGELVIWDERATQHDALADHFPARREMARFVVA